jgi:hypothetical protein
MPQLESSAAVIFQNPGGNQSALNITAAGVINASPITVYRIVVNNPGSAGNLTLNDCTTTGAADAANEIYTAAYSSLNSGQVIKLLWPCLNGLVLSDLPTDAVIAISAGLGARRKILRRSIGRPMRHLTRICWRWYKLLGWSTLEMA